MNFGEHVNRARAIVDQYTTGGGERCKRWHARVPANDLRGMLLAYVARSANKLAGCRAALKDLERDRSLGASQTRDLFDMELREACAAFNKARRDVETRLGVDPVSLLTCDEDAPPEEIRTAALDKRGGKLVPYRP